MVKKPTSSEFQQGAAGCLLYASLFAITVVIVAAIFFESWWVCILAIIPAWFALSCVQAVVKLNRTSAAEGGGALDELSIQVLARHADRLCTDSPTNDGVLMIHALSKLGLLDKGECQRVIQRYQDNETPNGGI